MKYKHFKQALLFKVGSILNPFSGAIPEEVVKNATKIGSYEIAQTLYIGALLDKIKYGEYTLDMQRFVDFVIYDMIKNIVVNTNETDKNLETALEGAKKVIDVNPTCSHPTTES